MIKTYTFKIKVDTDKIVCAVNMQLEQFFDSVKMTKLTLGELVIRYPHAYITACDYHTDDKYVDSDYCLSTLKCLLDSKRFKDYLTSADFYDFVGEDGYNPVCASQAVEKAHDYILSLEVNDEEDEESANLSETKQE